MQIDTDVEALAASQDGLITEEQARELGASRAVLRHRLTTGRWIRHHSGVYRIVGAAVTSRLEIRAATLAVPGAVASHETAASLVGLPGFDLLPVHVMVASSSGRPPGDVELHRTSRLPPHHLRVVEGIRSTSVARTLFDVCANLPPSRAERALDNALARRLVTRAAIERVFRELAVRGRKGSAVMRRLLVARDELYVAPESELEARFLELVRERQLPEPARQVDVGDADGWIGRVDFVFRDHGLIVEVDGRLAHSALLDRLADAERDQRLACAGWTVLRFSWHDVTRRSSWVAGRLRDALISASGVPPHPVVAPATIL